MTRSTSARIAGLAFLVYIAFGLAPIHGQALKQIIGLIENFCALTLAVTLWALTREHGPELAMLGLVFRVAEGILGAVPNIAMPVTALFFAMGSLFFCILLVRDTVLPKALSLIGVFASAVLVVALPLQLAGLLHTQLYWIPMLLFEVPAGFWLLIRGAPASATRTAVAES